MALARSTARRYAEAAFQIAERDDSIAAWLTAFEVAEERLSEGDASRLLGNPALASEDRVRLLERILGDDVDGAPRNLLALLVRRGRLDTLPAVSREFRRMHRRREGIVEARVSVRHGAPKLVTEATGALGGMTSHLKSSTHRTES